MYIGCLNIIQKQQKTVITLGGKFLSEFGFPFWTRTQNVTFDGRSTHIITKMRNLEIKYTF